MKSVNNGFCNRAAHSIDVVTTLLDTHKTLIDSYCCRGNSDKDEILLSFLSDYQCDYAAAVEALKSLRSSHHKVLNRLVPMKS